MAQNCPGSILGFPGWGVSLFTVASLKHYHVYQLHAAFKKRSSSRYCFLCSVTCTILMLLPPLLVFRS